MKTKKTITFTMCIDLIDRLKQLNRDEGLNMSYTAEQLFIEWLKERDDEWAIKKNAKN